MTSSYETLLTKLHTQETTDNPYPVQKFVPVCYEYDRILPAVQPDAYLCLTGGGRVDAAEPFALSVRPTDSLLLLYSIQGSGELTYLERSERISEGTTLLFRSSVPSRLRPAVLPWSFRLFFLKDSGLRGFLPFLPQCCATTAAKSPLISAAVEELSVLPAKAGSDTLLRMHRLLTDILTELCLEEFPQKPGREAALPTWLHDLHAYIHDCRNLSFSLARLETLYGISRYRLCREYAAAFQTSPLKDFNHVRMQEAKKMLLTTNLQVQEISNSLGYENINHFIHLFKAETGMTPKAFRQGHKA